MIPTKMCREVIDSAEVLASTAGMNVYSNIGANTPHLASALLNHRDPRVTEEHYNRASSISASKIYAEIATTFLRD